MSALRMLFGTLLVAVLAAPAPAATPAPPPAPAPTDTLRLTVDDAIAHALKTSDDVRTANAQVDFASARVIEASAAALPQFSGHLAYTKTFDSVFQGVADDDSLFGPILKNTSFAASNLWDASLTGQQVLLSRRVGAALAAAKYYRRSSEDQREETAASVKLAVRRAYLDAAYARDLVDIARLSLQLARDQERQAHLLFQQGARAEYDWVRAQVDARKAEPPVIAAENGYALALLELRRVAGLPLTQPLALTTPLRFRDGVPAVSLAAVGEPARAGLRAAENNVKTYQKALSFESGARWPDLIASATVSHQAFPGEWQPEMDDFRRNVQGTIKLDWPLVLGGVKTAGAVARAKAELRLAEVQRDELARTVTLQVEAARQEVRRALAELSAVRGTGALSQRTYDIAAVRFRNGLATSLELADARVQLLTSEVNEVQATKNYLAAIAGLEFAIGRPLATTTVPFDQLPRVVEDEVK
jgi:outer membrane protein TolC